MNAAISSSLTNMLGHTPPFSPDEMASVKGPLVFTGGKDLSELHDFLQLEDLTLCACEISDFAPLQSLLKLRRLSIIACIVPERLSVPLLPSLEQLTVNFSTVVDLQIPGEMPALKRIELQGNPLSDSCLHSLQLQDQNTEKRALLFSNPEDHTLTRFLYENKIQLGLATIDFRGSYLVRPGIPITANECDAAHSHRVLVRQRIQTEDKEITAENLIQESLAESQPVDRQRLQSRRCWGYATDAESWILSSDLSESEREQLLLFVRKFPEQMFYRDTEELQEEVEQRSGVILPGWLKSIRRVLAWLHPDVDEREVRVRFRRFELSGHPASDPERWYSISPGLFSGREIRKILETNNLLSTAVSDDPLWSQLLLRNDDSEDRYVFDFLEQSYRENVRDNADPVAYMGPVFESYTSMLAAVEEIKVGR